MRELGVPGLVLALVLAGAWIAPRWPELALPLQIGLGVLGCAVIAWNVRAVGTTPAALGIRVDNLLSASLAFGVVTATLGAGVVVVSRGGDLEAPFPGGELPSYFVWALFQQFLVVGGFWLPFRRAAGLGAGRSSLRREIALAGAAAVVFAAAHAPNPGLMVLVALVEWLWLCLFARWRNLLSLSLAHAAGALVIAHHLVPSAWLSSMRVGLDYLRP